MTREGQGFAMVGSFAKFLEPYVRASMKRRGEENWKIKPIPYKAEAYDKLYKHICNAKRRAADKQDLARFRTRVYLASILIQVLS